MLKGRVRLQEGGDGKGEEEGCDHKRREGKVAYIRAASDIVDLVDSSDVFCVSVQCMIFKNVVYSHRASFIAG